MARSSDLSRPWRGVSPQQRVAERRERLLQAGLEVFARQTFHGAKVRDVCQAAGLTERYFYESFSDKEELLKALADMIVGDFVSAAGPSILLASEDIDAAIRGAMRAVVHSLTDDPRRARILFVESVGVSPSAEEKRRAVIKTLVDVIVGAAEPAFGSWVQDSVEIELIARSLIGAAMELIVAHVRHELPLDQEGLIVNMTRLFMRARSTLFAVAGERSEHQTESETTRRQV